MSARGPRCSTLRPGPAVAGVLVVALASSMALAAPAEPAVAGITVAKLAWVDGAVERTGPEEESWRRVEEGDPVRTGDRLRTPAAGVARLEFPWMEVTLGPGSILSIPASAVLSTVLEKGRAEFSGEGRDIVKIQVDGGEIRGGGRLVLWREGKVTSASTREGVFRVSGAGTTATIASGQGTSMLAGGPPETPSALPVPPDGLVPGGDPEYVANGRSVELHWAPRGTAHHLEVLSLLTDDVLLARSVGQPPTMIEIPWLGTYRWRVSARDPRGLEGAPSSAGLICVVDE